VARERRQFGLREHEGDQHRGRHAHSDKLAPAALAVGLARGIVFSGVAGHGSAP